MKLSEHHSSENQQYFDEGSSSFNEQHPLDANPYTGIDTHKEKLWTHGWLSAQKKINVLEDAKAKTRFTWRGLPSLIEDKITDAITWVMQSYETLNQVLSILLAIASFITIWIYLTIIGGIWGFLFGWVVAGISAVLIYVLSTVAIPLTLAAGAIALLVYLNK